MGELIILPEYAKLGEEIKKLRAELTALFMERDELVLVTGKNIEMMYMLKLGALEYKAFEAQCAFMRAKRKLEMLQAKVNRQELIDIKAVEVALDEEFAQFKRLLEEQINKMDRAIERKKGDVLSEEETQEFKKLYRSIVRSLHPDIDPDSTPARRELFMRAVDAYENGDLETLRTIGEMVSDPNAQIKGGDTMEELYKERQRLAKLVEGVKQDISKITSEYPFTVRELVEDEEKAEHRRRELEEMIRQYEAATREYNARTERLLR